MSFHINTSACSLASAPSKFGSRVKLLEVMANREAFGQASAVVELEHRHRAARVLRQELRLLLLSERRSTVTVGISSPFSAMNSRTFRGLGAAGKS